MIAFEFLDGLYKRCENKSLEFWRTLYLRSMKRLEFGYSKYHKPMTPGDGRDSVADAWEECFDLCQYLLKCYREGRGDQFLYLYNTSLNMLIQLETETNNGGTDIIPKD